MQATIRDRGKLQGAQKISLHDTASNNGVISLGFGRYMSAGRQAYIAVNNGASEQCRGMSSNTGLPKITKGGPMKEGAAGGSRSGSLDDSMIDQGSMGEYLTVVPED